MLNLKISSSCQYGGAREGARVRHGQFSVSLEVAFLLSYFFFLTQTSTEIELLETTFVSILESGFESWVNRDMTNNITGLPSSVCVADLC